MVADAGDGAVPLTRLEFLLLRELAEHVCRSVPKGRLLASVWGYDFDRAPTWWTYACAG